MTTLHKDAGKPVALDKLTNIPNLISLYYLNRPDLAEETQRVRFGTSGHRGFVGGASIGTNKVLGVGYYRENVGSGNGYGRFALVAVGVVKGNNILDHFSAVDAAEGVNARRTLAIAVQLRACGHIVPAGVGDGCLGDILALLVDRFAGGDQPQ